MRMYLDVETAWAVDIKKVGAMRACTDDWARLNCLSWAMDDGPIKTLDFYQCAHLKANGKASTDPLVLEFIRDWEAAAQVVAHRAEFEIIAMLCIVGMWKPVSMWIDTMAKAGYYGYPMDLDGMSEALGCTALKDIQGRGVMLKLVNPVFTPDECPKDFERLYEYNAGDIEPMRQSDNKLPDLPPELQECWVLDTEINLRGVPIDVQMVNHAVELKEQFKQMDNGEMSSLTSGCVPTVHSTDKLVAWMTGRNVHMVDCTADTVDKTLATELLPLERRALELRQEAGLNSLAKYEAMQKWQVDGRVFGQHIWYGAHTGRPTGTGPQLLNLPRSEEAEYYAGVISKSPGFIIHMPKPAEKLKEGLRGSIRASKDSTLIGGDQKQGEARATGWVSGASNLLALFETTDPYCTYGANIFGHEINKKDHPDKRQSSKASVLANGFGGGIGAGQRIGVNYKSSFHAAADVVLPLANSRELAFAHNSYRRYRAGNPVKPLSEREGLAVDVLKQWYRRDFTRVKAYWFELFDAFMEGGDAGPICIRVTPSSGLRTLTLPSGRQLFYHSVRKHAKKRATEVETIEQEDDTQVVTYQGRYGRKELWYGTLMENVCQAISHDINRFYKKLMDTELKRLIGAGIIHHCYDEFTMEVPNAYAEYVMQKFKEITTERKPSWSGGFPLAFDYWQGERYGK